MQTFAEQFAAWDSRRKLARVSSLEVATRIGSDQATISRWRSGAQQPSVDRWREANEALDALISESMSRLRKAVA